ncbi:MAG TPA: DUF1707 domain-containing protein [Micropruina sp.]|nr:DUF1707 domain-containing protein [Micropruina sp.]
MSTPQWQNLPVPPNSGGSGWAAFSVDPRDPQFQHLRASDADRTTAATMLAGALADGRLDQDEYDQRLNQVTSAKSMGELVPVLGDLTVDRPTQPPPAFAASQQGWSRRGGMIGPFPRWWLGLVLMFNAIWLMTSFSAGHVLYYWPMWPILGTAIPMIMGMVAGGNRRRPPQEYNRQLPPSSDQDLR